MDDEEPDYEGGDDDMQNEEFVDGEDGWADDDNEAGDGWGES